MRDRPRRRRRRGNPVRGHDERHGGAGARGRRRLRLRPAVRAGRGRRSHDGRAGRRREGCDLAPGPRRSRARGVARAMTRRGSAPVEVQRSRAAAVSIFSNTALIALKVIAGLITGSVANIPEAIHPAVDLAASFIAYFSVRQAETPADEEHRYGHEKFENVAAAAEGVLILVGSGVIVYAAVRSLVKGPELSSLGLGIGVVAFATATNLVISTWLYAQARASQSQALEADAAHLRTDAFTSLGVLVGLTLAKITGAHWLDPAVALMIAAAIVVTGLRIVARSWGVLVDEALPDEEQRVIQAAIEAFAGRGIVGYHQLR